MFKDGFNSAPSPKDTVRRRRYGLFSIFLFRIGLQIGPDAGKNAKQADDVVQYCHPTLYFLLREFRERAIILTIGALAQLGERKVRNLEVRGSIPLCSTNLEDSPTRVTGWGFVFYRRKDAEKGSLFTDAKRFLDCFFSASSLRQSKGGP